MAIAALTVLLLAAFGVIVWQESRVDEAASSLTAAETELEISAIEVERLQAEVQQLEAQLARAETETQSLEREVERLRGQLSGSKSSAQQAETTLQQTQAQLAQTQTELATAQANEASARAAYQDARADLQALAGTPLGDGEWTGRLFMVGGNQVPPMLAYDEMKLYRGDDAIAAMIADGVPQAEAERCGPSCTYWRNPSEEWRIMTIAPDATVVLKTYRSGGPTTIGLEKFTRIFNGTAPQNDHLAAAPYRLTMSGGEVTGIREMTVSW